MPLCSQTQLKKILKRNVIDSHLIQQAVLENHRSRVRSSNSEKLQNQSIILEQNKTISKLNTVIITLETKINQLEKALQSYQTQEHDLLFETDDEFEI